MKNLIATLAMITLFSISLPTPSLAQKTGGNAATKTVVDTLADDALDDTGVVDEAETKSTPNAGENTGVHQFLKTKFIEGSAGFMSLVALALVLGLAFCIERIIYLSLSEINAKKFMNDLEAKIDKQDIEGAKPKYARTGSLDMLPRSASNRGQH